MSIDYDESNCTNDSIPELLLINLFNLCKNQQLLKTHLITKLHTVSHIYIIDYENCDRCAYIPNRRKPII